MNRELAKELSTYAVNKYGADFEIDRCIEEMSELTKALLKDRRDSSYDAIEDILYELGDVLFTLTHIQTAYEIEDKFIDDMFNKSMNRFRYEEKLYEQ